MDETKLWKTGSTDVQELVVEMRRWRRRAEELERAMGAGIDWMQRRLDEIVSEKTDAQRFLVGKHLGCGGVIVDHQETGESPGGERCTACGIKGHPLERIKRAVPIRWIGTWTEEMMGTKGKKIPLTSVPCTGPDRACPPPGTVGLDIRAECPKCGRRVGVTARGRYARHMIPRAGHATRA